MTLRPFFEERRSLIQWNHLCKNSNSKIIDFLEVNLDKINWYELSANCVAMPLLLQHPDKIYWPFLTKNTHPDAIALLELNPSKHKPLITFTPIENINPNCWYELSKTYDAQTLEKHEELIHWFTVWENPDIFEPDDELYVLK
jgi:hypothetical protein